MRFPAILWTALQSFWDALGIRGRHRPNEQKRVPAIEKAKRPPTPTHQLMDVREVAVELGVQPSRVYALCRGGGLPHSRVGDSILVRFEELKSWRSTHAVLD